MRVFELLTISVCVYIYTQFFVVVDYINKNPFSSIYFKTRIQQSLNQNQGNIHSKMGRKRRYTFSNQIKVFPTKLINEYKLNPHILGNLQSKFDHT